MTMRPRGSNQREQFIEDAERLWQNNIVDAQRRLLATIRREYFPRLERADGRLVVSPGNYATLTTLDTIYERFIATEIDRLVKYFIRQARRLFGLGVRYIDGQTPDVRGDAFTRNIADAERQVFTALGFDPSTGRVIPGGPLERIFSDVRPIQEIKREVSNAIQSAQPVDDALSAITRRVVGAERRAGALDAFLSESLPQPFQQFDRENMLITSEKLGVQCYVYQGGLIRDSRPFCIERNDKVFTRDEIAKFGTAGDAFGGYTNKSAGEFQGKCPKFGYNPFRDLGGCNCRHQLDPISNELAIRLRPELRDILTTT